MKLQSQFRQIFDKFYLTKKHQNIQNSWEQTMPKLVHDTGRRTKLLSIFDIQKRFLCHKNCEMIWKSQMPMEAPFHFIKQNKNVSNGPLIRYVKLRVAHAPGMPATFSPPLMASDPDMHHGTRVTHVQLEVSFEVGGGENVPGIPGVCVTYLVRGPWNIIVYRKYYIYISNSKKYCLYRCILGNNLSISNTLINAACIDKGVKC